MVRHIMWVLTFDNAGELFHVVVCFAVVNHSGNREDQLGLDLRKPVKDTLKRERERRLKPMKMKSKNK